MRTVTKTLSPFAAPYTDAPLASDERALLSAQKRRRNRRSDPSTDLSACHLAYLSPDTFDDKQLVSRLEKYPILTVGEENSSAMIRFLSRIGKVRFAIDSVAAGRANLRASSQLLKLSSQ